MYNASVERSDGDFMKKQPQTIVRDYRAKKKLSLREMGEKCGMSHTNIHAIECGQRGITASAAKKLGKAMRVNWVHLCTE
jgi:transcriptional regulator with XRE-family HTH domain